MASSSSSSRCPSPTKPVVIHHPSNPIPSNPGSLTPSLSRRPTHKLSRSNSLSFSANPKSKSNSANQTTGNEPSSPTKRDRPSSLIIHRSQTLSAKPRPVLLASATARSLNPPRTLNSSSLHSRSSSLNATNSLSSPSPQPSASPCRSTHQTHPSSPTDDEDEKSDLFTTPQKKKLPHMFSRPHEVVAEELESIQESSPLSTPQKAEELAQSESGNQYSTSGTSENVIVCVRARPMHRSSLSDIDVDTPILNRRQTPQSGNCPQRFGSWLIDPIKSSITLSACHPIINRRGTGTSEGINGSEGYGFSLDRIFDPYSTTDDLYRFNIQPIIKSCVKDGYNATVFAYGQTGSGKTFTMMGANGSPDDEDRGVIPRAVDEVFQTISTDQEREYLLRVSYLEIYNEALKDLLVTEQPSGGASRLTIQENNKGRVYVNGLREEVVTHPMQVLETLDRGEKARHVGATDWNERSSRSHTVFTMTIESRPKLTSPGVEPLRTQISQLNLIDLAGSESAATSTERRKEGAFINKSLLALSNVISKLSKHEPHIPYRDSKLTRLLQTSLGGNAKVVVICAISIGADSAVETLSTLRFARRAKMVVTKAERGTVLDDRSALLEAYQREIESLKAQLHQNSQALSITSTSTPVLAELNAEKSKAESELMTLQLERIRLQEQIEHLNRRILTSHTIESNVRRAGSVNESRRIVSGQEFRPRRKAKARVTDLGGMMSLIGVGLRPGFLPTASLNHQDTTPKKFIDSREPQCELELRKELEILRSEIKELLQQKERMGSTSAISGLGLLKDQIRALEDEKENNPAALGDRHDDLKRQIKELEDQLEISRQEQQKLLDSSDQRIQTLQDLLSSSQAEEKLHLNNVQINDSLIPTTDWNEQQQTRILELDTKLADAQGVDTTQKEMIQRLQRELDGYIRHREETQAERLTLKQEIRETEQKLSLLQKEFDEYRESMLSRGNPPEVTPSDELASSEARILALESQLSQAELRSDELRGQLAQKHTTTNALTVRVDELTVKISEAESQIEQIAAAKMTAEQDLEKLKVEAHSMQMRIQTLEGSLLAEQTAKAQVELDLTAQADKTRDELALLPSLKSETTAMQVRLEKTQQKLSLERSRRNDKELELFQTQQERDESRIELERLQRLVETLLTTHEEKVRSTERDWKAKVERAEAMANQTVSSYQDLESRLKTVQSEAAAHQTDLHSLQADHKIVTAQNQNLNHAIDKLNQQVTQMQDREKQIVQEVEQAIGERSQKAQSALQETYKSNLEHMKSHNLELEGHIRGLESHLSKLGNGTAPQTTAESMETIVELQTTVEEQNREISTLKTDLVAALKLSRSRPNADHYHQSTEDEFERLHHIIDEQEKRLSDAKTDLSKWQARVRSQTEMIAKLQTDPDSFFGRSTGRTSPSKNSLSASTSASMASPTFLPSRLTGGPSNGILGQSQSSSGSRSSRTRSMILSGSSPRPLPVPESFVPNEEDEWQKRKHRRRTIEKDMAKLKDENVVERKLNVLMSSTPNPDPSPQSQRSLPVINKRIIPTGTRRTLSQVDGTSFLPAAPHLAPPRPPSSAHSSQGYYE